MNIPTAAQALMPGPGPIVVPFVESLYGTRVSLVGRFEFQGLDVVEARGFGGSGSDLDDLVFLLNLF